MDFTVDETFRAEVRAVLDQLMTPQREERLYRDGVSHDPEFNAALLERGWFLPQDLVPGEQEVLHDELSRADAPTYAAGTTNMVARIVEVVGTDEQKQQILAPARRGEIVMVLGFSEPEAGSDVAAAQTRAVRDGDEWVIDGQKMFTTNGHIADYVFLLARTNRDVPKHKGLTMFLVPTDQPGIEVQAVYTLSGERTNITFYNGVRVHDRWRLGGVDKGWEVLTVSLQDEHSAGFGARLARLLEDAEAWARTSLDAATGRPRLDDPEVRERLARCAAETEVSLLLQRRAAWMADNGMVPVAEGPMAKLVSSEAMERCAQDLTELLGPDGLRSRFEPTAPVGGRIEHALRFSLGTTIYAGTSEIQRTIIAQRGLGLPRQ